MGIIKRITIIVFIILLLIYFYDKISLRKIVDKEFPQYLRIGYINLHKSKITVEELKKLEKYNCDLWLFLEWNGNNTATQFLQKYKVYEVRDKRTFGICILSKKKNISVTKLKTKKNYVCNYPKYIIKYGMAKSLEILLIHAPPPVPACGIQTSEYLADFTSEVLNRKTEGSSILVGDFNALPFMSSIKKIKQAGYIDAQHQLNRLPQGTYGIIPWFPKIAAIDYVFYKGELDVKYIARFSISTSDHSGWITDFQLNTIN